MSAVNKLKVLILFITFGLMFSLSVMGISHVLTMDSPSTGFFRDSREVFAGKTNGFRMIDVPYIDQREKYPNGCESVSAVMALQNFGISITPEEFIDIYLPQGSAPYLNNDGYYEGDDPAECFLGSPYSQDGWGCYSGVIAYALRSFLSGEDYSVEEPENKTINELCGDYIDRDIPVILWATIDMREPQEGMTWTVAGTNRSVTWTAPLHALVLVGYDDEYYYFNDPLQGKGTAYARTLVEERYNYMGQQCVVIIPDGNK